MKLLCDQMLGTLAKWLRILGFNTFFANSEVTDEDLINLAKKENRIVISRDKELILKSRKQNIKTIEIKDFKLDEQLLQVLAIIKIEKKLILQRCTLCNSEIKTIDKSKVKGEVPEKVYKNNYKFWYCSKCKKFYWMGSHYDKINEKIKDIISKK